MHVHHATISIEGSVAYRGTDGGYEASVYTYTPADAFNWARLPDDTPVIDCSAADVQCLYRALSGPPLHGAEHVERYRACGVPVRTVAETSQLYRRPA